MLANLIQIVDIINANLLYPLQLALKECWAYTLFLRYTQ